MCDPATICSCSPSRSNTRVWAGVSGHRVSRSVYTLFDISSSPLVDLRLVMATLSLLPWEHLATPALKSFFTNLWLLAFAKTSSSSLLTGHGQSIPFASVGKWSSVSPIRFINLCWFSGSRAPAFPRALLFNRYTWEDDCDGPGSGECLVGRLPEQIRWLSGLGLRSRWLTGLRSRSGGGGVGVGVRGEVIFAAAKYAESPPTSQGRGEGRPRESWGRRERARRGRKSGSTGKEPRSPGESPPRSQERVDRERAEVSPKGSIEVASLTSCCLSVVTTWRLRWGWQRDWWWCC